MRHLGILAGICIYFFCNYAIISLVCKVRSRARHSSGEVWAICILGIIFGKGGITSFSFHSCKASVSGFLAPIWFQRNIQFICIFPNVGFTVLPRCQQTPTHWRRMKTKSSSSFTFVPYQFIKSK